MFRCSIRGIERHGGMASAPGRSLQHFVPSSESFLGHFGSRLQGLRSQYCFISRMFELPVVFRCWSGKYLQVERRRPSTASLFTPTRSARSCSRSRAASNRCRRLAAASWRSTATRVTSSRAQTSTAQSSTPSTRFVPLPLLRYSDDEQLFPCYVVFQSSPKHEASCSLLLGGHRAPVACVDWSRSSDTTICVSASMDGAIRISTLLPQ